MFDKQFFKESVRRFLIKMSGNHKISYETKLFDEGIIDSLNFVQLVLFIEKKFGIQLKPFSIQIEDFESLTTLSEVISSMALESKNK